MLEFLITALPWIILGLMLLSLFALVVPVFPGGVVIWFFALLYGLLNPNHFGTLGGIMFALISVLAIASGLADNFFMGAKAKEAGASWRGIIIALIAGVVAAIFLTPIGGIVVAALSLYLVEYIRLNDREQAMKITRALVVGCGWAFVARFGIGIVQISLWGIWAWNSF